MQQHKLFVKPTSCSCYTAVHMRFASRWIGSVTTAFVLTGAVGLFLPVSSLAATNAAIETGTPAQGFDQLVGTGNDGAGAVGLVFLNICEGPAPVEGGPADTCTCRSEGRCDLDDIMQLFVNISILILGVSGSLVLLMFIYGGFLWVTSRGDAKRIEKGKETVTQAVIGFAIIVLSYSIINFAIAALAGDQAGSTIEETIDNAGDGNPDLQTTGQ